MPDQSELKWTKDVIRLFPDCWNGIWKARLWFAIVVISGVVTPLAPEQYHLSLLSVPVLLVIAVQMILAVIREIWHQEVGSSEAAKEQGKKFGILAIQQAWFLLVETPLLLLYLVIYVLFTKQAPRYEAGGIFFAIILGVMSIPSSWWLIKSSLASVLVVIEDAGIVSSVIKSHKLLNGRFWLVAGYLVPPFLLIQVPCMAASLLVDSWYRSTLAQEAGQTWLAIVIGISSLAAYGAVWVAWMSTTYPLLIRLYFHVRNGAKDEVERR